MAIELKGDRFGGEDTHNRVALAHTLSERDFLLIAFSQRVREKVCRRIFLETKTKEHFLEIDRVA